MALVGRSPCRSVSRMEEAGCDTSGDGERSIAAKRYPTAGGLGTSASRRYHFGCRRRDSQVKCQ